MVSDVLSQEFLGVSFSVLITLVFGTEENLEPFVNLIADKQIAVILLCFLRYHVGRYKTSRRSKTQKFKCKNGGSKFSIKKIPRNLPFIYPDRHCRPVHE